MRKVVFVNLTGARKDMSYFHGIPPKSANQNKLSGNLAMENFYSIQGMHNTLTTKETDYYLKKLHDREIKLICLMTWVSTWIWVENNHKNREGFWNSQKCGKFFIPFLYYLVKIGLFSKIILDYSAETSLESRTDFQSYRFCFLNHRQSSIYHSKCTSLLFSNFHKEKLRVKK